MHALSLALVSLVFAYAILALLTRYGPRRRRRELAVAVAAGLAGAVLSLAAPAYAQGVPPRCDTATCTFQWTPATGPVQGYEVWVKRGAAAFAKELDTPVPSAALLNTKSETVVVRVRAYATDVSPRRSGPDSLESDPTTFLPPLGAPGKPGLAAP